MKLRRIISTAAAAAMMLCSLTIPGSAASPGIMKTVINVTGSYITVTDTSTLYAGRVTEGGSTLFTYLWSEDITNTSYVFATARNCFNGMEDKSFAELIPAEADEESKGLSVCSSAAMTPKMNSDWTTAEGAANKVYSKPSIKSKSSADLYGIDEGFAAACHILDENIPAENILDTDGNVYTVTCPLGKLSATNTDVVTYTVEDGVLVKHIDRTIDYTCEAVRVIYTTADIRRSSVSTATAEEQIKRKTTVYLGEVTSKEGTFKYVWSDGLDVCMDSITPLKTALAGMEDQDFIALIPELTFDYEKEEYSYSKLAFCSDPAKQEDMDAQWASAAAVGRKYFPSLAPDVTVSDNLYDSDTGFAAAVDALDAKRRAEIDKPADTDKSFIWHYDSHAASDVYYTIEDGIVVRHTDLNVCYDCDDVTVIYTKAVISDALLGDVNKDTKINVKDLTALQKWINGWPVVINENAADVTGDTKKNVKDLVAIQKIINGMPV